MQRENKWQERFDEKFKKWIFHNEHGLCVFPDKITEFIQSEIDTAIAEERNSIVDRYENINSRLTQIKQPTDYKISGQIEIINDLITFLTNK